MMELSEEKQTRALFVFFLFNMGGYSEKISVCHPGRAHSGGTELLTTLNMGFSEPRNVRNKYLFFKSSVSWYFVSTHRGLIS
jgi:hypothetical protein